MNITESFNVDNWPIVYFKINNMELNDDIYEEYQKFYLSLLIKCKKNNEKMIFISDLKTLENKTDFPMKYIMKQIQFNKKVYDFNKKYVKCFIVLCNNKKIKTIINTLFMIVKPAAPFKLCRDSIKVSKYLLEKFDIIFDIHIYENEISDEINDEESDDVNEVNNINNLYNLNKEIDNDTKKKFDNYINELKS